MNRVLLLKLCSLLMLCLLALPSHAQIETYPWPANSGLIDHSKYDIRVRTRQPSTQSFGPWVDLKVFLSTQRSYPNHWKCGGDAGTDFLADRSLSFVSFAFSGQIEVEVTQKLTNQLAQEVVIAPKGYGIRPHFFDGKTVRFIMPRPRFVSVDFQFGEADKTINRDDNRKQGADIRHGCMILADRPEGEINAYGIPSPTGSGVVVWDNDTDLSTIRDANIIYFPPGEHYMRDHKDRWERNSSWDQSEAQGNWVRTEAEYDNAPLYRGRLFLGKDNQRVYLAPGAIVYGGFFSHGHEGNWLYGRGIISGREHLMHEIVKPATGTIPETDPYELVTKTKEAFCDYGHGAVYDGVTFLEAWHHTCPSGQNSRIRRIKIIGWCSNNDGIRPASGSLVETIFIKTSDDYDYARGQHTVTDAVMWPMVNGAVGQLGWNNLGDGFAEYEDMHVIHSEWHETGIAQKGNVGIICGGKANAGIKLQDNVYENIYIEDKTNLLVGVLLEGTTGTGYLRNFKIKNVTTEYPFQNPAGTPVKQDLTGKDNTWCEGWTFTNVFIGGVLLTWDNHKDYFNLDLVGTNGNNTDNARRARNITFDTEGKLYTITYSATTGGTVRPSGANKVIQVAEGMDQTITIDPADGHRIQSITVDGTLRYEWGNPLKSTRNPYWKFGNIQANHTIDVVFAQGDDYFDLAIPGVLSTDHRTFQEVKVYPNPTTDYLSFDLPGFKGGRISIYNLNGTLVYQDSVPVSQEGISVSQLVTGIYQLEIYSENRLYRAQFVKE